MKPIKMLIVGLLCLSQIVIAQPNTYNASMQLYVAQLDTCYQTETFNQLATNFEQLALKNTSEWLPYYFAAYCKIAASFSITKPSSIDSVLDTAEKWLITAEKNMGTPTEIETLKGYLASARIMPNPMQRGAKYGKLSDAFFNNAIKMDSLNPRPYFLLGQSKFYTPKIWGGGKKVAFELLTKASKNYEQQKPQSNIHPRWGLQNTQFLLNKCKE